MWTFPGLLFLFIISAFPSAWIVRAFIPWFWAHTVAPAHILITVTTIPEIDNAVYISFIILFVFLFVINVWISSWVYKRHRRFSQIIAWVNYSVALYLLLVSNKSLFELDQIEPMIALGAGLVGILLARIRMTTLVGLVALKFLFAPLILYDIGSNPFVLIFDYVYIGFFAVLVGCGFMVRFHVTRRRLIAFLFGGITISLLYLMTEARSSVDIYFTLLPAYHFLHGGTPMVSLMSQYGLLYLVPWITWLVLFPGLPISFQAGVVLTTLLLVVYFYCFTIVVSRLIQNRLIFVFTVLASYYFTILIRYFGFPDPVSLVSTPAFTPLRFGMFMIPFTFLLLYCRRFDQKYLNCFFVVSALGFFYSFEIGTGILIAALVVAIIHGSARNFLVLFGYLAAFGIALSVYFFLRSGQIPDWGSYMFFSKIYSLGYLMLPIGSQTVVFLPIALSLFGILFGLWRIIAKRDVMGYLVMYLAIINLVELPYYMGRSIYPTLYNVSLPFVLLCGVIIEKIDRKNIGSWIVTAMCSFVIGIGGFRALGIIGSNVLHTFEIVEASGEYIQKSFTQWDIQTNPSYIFLAKHLPSGCPLIAFDQNEFELLTATHATPAYEYGFVWGFITSTEQIDHLRPYPGHSKICLFVNDNYIDSKEDIVNAVYHYYWNRYGMKAQRVAEDSLLRLRLYELSVALE